MEKVSYKNRFILIVIFLFIIAIAILYNFLSSISSSNVGDISVKNFKAKAFERENFINHFFAPYISTIKSIKNDKNFINYLSGELDKEYIENYFLSIKNSLPSLYQVRYLDNNSKEVIKIDGTSLDIYGNSAISNIVPNKYLEIKNYRDYIKEFLSLKDEIGFSYIDLNIENKKIVIPKQPTLRIGTPVFNKNGIQKGLIILNISLKIFFERLDNSTLYNIYLIDKNGKFLNHNQSNKYGLLGENMNYSIKDEFKEEYNAIFANDEYYGNTFYSKKLKNFNSNQNVKLILSLKYSNEFNHRKKKEEDLIIYFIIFILISLVTISYFSSLPDKLREEMSNNKYTNILTKLPNRLSLIKDLSQGEFKNSVVILIAINNLIKIQNSYGQRISDQLVKKIGKFLSNFKNKNIEKVYINSYNVFTIKYHYTNDDTLKEFLNNFLKNIENEAFIIKRRDLEFYLDVTIGVSDPHKINNNIEELNEAENALDNALNKDLHLDIFNVFHKNDTEKQKENINLAKQIKKALENDCIILHYQPILNNLTNNIEKYESLIRMKVNDNLIFPDTFLPISKQIKKYNNLSKKVIDKSFDFFKDKNIEFSINLSILDILNEEFSDHLLKKLEEYNIGSKLVLEIVEQEGVDNFEDFQKFVKRIKNYGCKIAIDDFGSGYSNFEYIIKMSDYIDYLKLDGSLIKDLTTNKKSIYLIQSIVFLCSQLHIKTIAEYVENEELQKLLVLLGIDYSQGYYIGKPNKELI